MNLQKCEYQLDKKLEKMCRKLRAYQALVRNCNFSPQDRDKLEALRLEFEACRDKISETILSKIRGNMPELRFKACPWCNEEPRLAVSLRFD